MSATTPDRELWALLDATGFAISRLRQLELADLGLTIEQAALLARIHATRGGTTARRIEEATLRQQHTVSALVKRMAAMGLVYRERGPGETESRILLTKRGRELRRIVPTASLDAVFGAIPSGQRKPLACALRSLHDKARSLLVPATPPFMRYASRGTTADSGGQEDDDTRFSPYRLWSSLDATRFAISRLRELELARFGLTVEQSSVLTVLVDRRAPMTSRELEDATLRQHHSVSTLVNRMIRMGLVVKEQTPGERSRRILITSAGKSLTDGITATALEVTFGVLSDATKQRLAACLRSLYATARDLLGMPGVSAPSGVHSTR